MATATKKKHTKVAATPAASEVKPRPSKAKTAKAKTSTATATTKATPKVKKAPATKTAAKATTKKAATKAPAAKKEAAAPVERDFNVHGFIEGSDSALIVNALVQGGASRKESIENAAKEIDKTNGLSTRSGGKKNIPSLTSSLIKRLEEKGYTIEESWKIVPPKEVQDQIKKEEAAAKRKAARASKK